MIKVVTPLDKHEFNYKECKKLFNKYKDKINDDQEFRDIVRNTFFYSFSDENGYIGSIYYYEKNGKLFVNAYAKRHRHKTCLECFKMSLDYFTCDIYAQTTHKTAILCLLRSGFKKIGDNLYKYER